jgi:hypothetical protein
MWKAVVVTCLKVHKHIRVGFEKINKRSLDSRITVLDSDLEPPEYETEALTIYPLRSLGVAERCGYFMFIFLHTPLHLLSKKLEFTTFFVLYCTHCLLNALLNVLKVTKFRKMDLTLSSGKKGGDTYFVGFSNLQIGNSSVYRIQQSRCLPPF